MSRARHGKAGGGAVKPLPIKPGTPEWLEGRSGSSPDRTKGIEALADRIKSGKKDGGKVVGKAPGAKSKPRMDKRARGGRIATPTSPFSGASSPSPKSMA